MTGPRAPGAPWEALATLLDSLLVPPPLGDGVPQHVRDWEPGRARSRKARAASQILPEGAFQAAKVCG